MLDSAGLKRLAFGAFKAILLVCVASTISLAQQDSAPTPAPVARIPFVLFHDRVYLPVEVNGQSRIEMVLDTGAAMSALSDHSANAIHLQARGKADLVGNGKSTVKIRLAKNVTFRLGEVELSEKSVAVVPFEGLEEHEGRRIEGVLGVNLFRRYVVEIDYPARMLALYEPNDFVYHGSGERVPLRAGHAALFNAVVELPGRAPLTCDLAIDSGTYSAVRLYRPFVEKNQLSQLPGVDSFGFGLGGEFPERLGRIGVLRIGALVLNNPVTSFSTAQSGATSSGSYDGTIGGEVLSRFKVVLDYPHQQMLLEPAGNFTEPWPADTGGMILQATGTDLRTLSVLHLSNDTPAAAAGVQEGDTIISVDGQESSTLGVEGIRHLFTTSGTHRLQLQHAHQAFEIEITTTKPLY